MTETGLGEGVFRTYTQKDGTIAGHSWSTQKRSEYHDQGGRHLVIGRLLQAGTNVGGQTSLQPYGQKPDEVIYAVSRGLLNKMLLSAAGIPRTGIRPLSFHDHEAFASNSDKKYSTGKMSS